jgi:hypothetical protein
MSLFGLSSLAPAGLGAIAGQAAGRLVDGFSFAESLLRPEDASPEETKSVPVEPTEQATSEFQEALHDFRQRLQLRLAAQGVDLGRPITLRGDGFGGVEVEGDHPDRARIEQILAGDAELTADFQRLSGQYAAAAGENQPLAGDDESACARVLDDIHRRGFRVTFHGDQAHIEK